MSNFTEQYILNAGLYILQQDVIATDGATITQIPNVDGTNFIRVCPISFTRQTWIGDLNLMADGSNGFPLFTTMNYWDSQNNAQVTWYAERFVEYMTSKPDTFYLTSNTGSNTIVQYLAYCS